MWRGEGTVVHGVGLIVDVAASTSGRCSELLRNNVIYNDFVTIQHNFVMVFQPLM